MSRSIAPDRTVLVTPGSSGIGLARLGFADRGSRVFGTSRHDREGVNGVTMVRLDVSSTTEFRSTGLPYSRPGPLTFAIATVIAFNRLDVH